MAQANCTIGLSRAGILSTALALSSVPQPVVAQSGVEEGQSSENSTIQGREETLENGDVITHILPSDRPATLPPPPLSESLGARSAPAEPARGRDTPSDLAPSVLAILSHPDDEIILAPILARIAREGGNVTLVFATSGDAGPGVSGLPMGKALASAREDEAVCSAFALGVDEPIFWRFGDGTLANEARNTQSTMRDMGERISALIELHEPSVIMTWGPGGGYGHADHRMMSNSVTQVVQALGPERPDLLYAAFPAITASGEDGDDNARSDTAPLPGFEGWAQLHPSLITDRIAYEVPDLDATIAAVNCYESQFDATARRMLAGTLHERVWRGKVSFRLAFAQQR